MVRPLLIVLASLSIQPAAAGEYTIAIAHLLKPGTCVTVEGSVTVLSGALFILDLRSGIRLAG
jgi:hypothetical protein